VTNSGRDELDEYLEKTLDVGGGKLSTSTQLFASSLSSASITENKIADFSVTSAKIRDAAITNAKIENLAASKITTGTLAVDVAITVNDGSNDRVLIGKF
jgi:hypothetical protein